jgi:hypothetical protein
MPDKPLMVDLSLPIDIEFQVTSPSVVVFWCWYQLPGHTGWVELGTGTDPDNIASSLHQYQVGPLPALTRFKFRFIINGNPHTVYRVQLRLGQQGRPIVEDKLQGTLMNTTEATEYAYQLLQHNIS